jgi:tryptophan synthase alpha chain
VSAVHPLERHLRTRRDAGHKLLAPYVTGGLGAHWVDAVHAVVAAGADVVEIGIPFSDPVMDGPTIQEASVRALAAGTTPESVLADLAQVDVAVPLVVMTYANLVAHMGFERFAARLAEVGVAGAILPDLPLDELEVWGGPAAQHGIATVLLAAPTTPDDRLVRICERSQGFVYGVSLLGVTGERASLSGEALRAARRLKDTTTKPALLGVGISTPEQAVEACTAADGVVIGSAVVRCLLGTGGADAAGRFVAAVRAALDDATVSVP